MEKIMMRVALVSLLSLVVACSGTRKEENQLREDEIVVFEDMRFPGVDGREVGVVSGIYRVARTDEATLKLSAAGVEYLLRAGPANVEGKIAGDRAILAGSEDSSQRRLIWLSKGGSIESIGNGGGVRGRGSLLTLPIREYIKLTVVAPTATSLWRVGSTQTIQWTKTGTQSSYVVITLFKEVSGSLQEASRIMYGVPNAGSWLWPIPANLTPGRYAIYVQTLDGQVKDFSDVFRIVPPAQFQGLGDLPGGSWHSKARAVSADGSVIVGESSSANGREAFRWNQSTGMVGLGDFPEGQFMSEAYAVSADGSVVIGTATGGNPDLPPMATYAEAFRWTSEVGMTHITPYSWERAYFREGTGVSADGSVIVGSYMKLKEGVTHNTEDFSMDNWVLQAVRWSGGPALLLGTFGYNTSSFANAVSADGSVVVGDAGGGAFRWSSSTGIVKICSGTANAITVNPSTGTTTIVGQRDSWPQGTLGPLVQEAFLWRSDTGLIQVIGALPDGWTPTEATGVSADGTVVVGNGIGPNKTAWCFVWDANKGTRKLVDVITGFGGVLTGWTLYEATAVSADGRTIIGNGRKNWVEEAWKVTFPVTPPP